MKNQVAVSKATIDRLPLYFRALGQVQEEGLEIISSEDLGHRIGVTPEQIRKDLAAFGEFGKKGVGYFVRDLIGNIGEILGFHRRWFVAIVGAGHLGWALANYRNFSRLGFEICAVFDHDSKKIGQSVNGIEIMSMDRIEAVFAQKQIQIAIITVPAAAAQDAADQAVRAGVKGIWNFAPVKLAVPPQIHLCNEDLSVGLSSISFYLNREIDEKSTLA